MNRYPNRLLVLRETSVDENLQSAWWTTNCQSIGADSTDIGLGNPGKSLRIVSIRSFSSTCWSQLTLAWPNTSINFWPSCSRIPETSTDQLGDGDLAASTSPRTLVTHIPNRRARTTVSIPAVISSPTVLEELTAAAASCPVQRPTMKLSDPDG